MGYFSNGSEGEWYEAQYCNRCVHQPAGDIGCPVLDLHLLYNYDQLRKDSTRRALAMFIPEKDGRNGQCAMFWERGRGGGGGSPEPLPAKVPLTVVRAA